MSITNLFYKEKNKLCFHSINLKITNVLILVQFYILVLLETQKELDLWNSKYTVILTFTIPTKN